MLLPGSLFFGVQELKQLGRCESLSGMPKEGLQYAYQFFQDFVLRGVDRIDQQEDDFLKVVAVKDDSKCCNRGTVDVVHIDHVVQATRCEIGCGRKGGRTRCGGDPAELAVSLVGCVSVVSEPDRQGDWR